MLRYKKECDSSQTAHSWVDFLYGSVNICNVDVCIICNAICTHHDTHIYCAVYAGVC